MNRNGHREGSGKIYYGRKLLKLLENQKPRPKAPASWDEKETGAEFPIMAAIFMLVLVALVIFAAAGFLILTR